MQTSKDRKISYSKQVHNIKQKYQIAEENYTGNDIEDLKTVSFAN
jgi:hypothetical protein